MNANRPRCPVCNQGLEMWSAIYDVIHAECDKCDWSWSE